MTDFIKNEKSASNLINNNDQKEEEELMLSLGKFPPQSSKIIKTISSIDNKEIITEIICTTYQDKIFVVITQIKKFGTLISAWYDINTNGEKSFRTSVLLGKREDPILHVFARQIIGDISFSSESDKPLLLSISLDSNGNDPETFKKIISTILEIKTWH
jgi:proteasome assembly chaperone 3